MTLFFPHWSSCKEDHLDGEGHENGNDGGKHDHVYDEGHEDGHDGGVTHPNSHLRVGWLEARGAAGL